MNKRSNRHTTLTNPVCVKIAIEKNPLGILVRLRAEISHDLGEKAVLPLARRGVDVAVELLGSHGLGVKVDDFGLPRRLQLQARGLQRVPALALATCRRAHDEDAVTNDEELFKLNNLEAKELVGVEAALHARNLDSRLELFVLLTRRVDSREKIPEQATVRER